MCGIAGIWSPQAAEGQLRGMLHTLHHRGPDDQGQWQAPGGPLLGQCRLSILDLSAAGHQPMLAEDEGLGISFNGEIYNFPELRRELEGLGHRFRSSSDTEVLLRGYQQWGVGVVRRLVGMFAFAIWDARRQELVLARDRAGEKPLYYAQVGDQFAFASEVQALVELPWVDRAIDPQALSLYLTYQYVPAPHSIYRGIRKLPPAHVMQLRQGQAPQIWRYWDPASFAVRPNTLTETEALEQLEPLLAQSVRGQLLSDVPLGAFLSGGIDSSLVVALMQEQAAGRVRTFTIGFDVPEYNEAPHAEAVARHLGTDHTTEYLSVQDALNLIPELPRMYGEPFADSSALPTHLVSRVARQHVTVALSGDGGDEAFGGYTRYDLVERFGPVAARLGPVAPLLRAARPALPKLAQRLSEVAGFPLRDIYRGTVSLFSAQEAQALTGVAPALPGFEAAWDLPGLSTRRHAMLADLMTYLPEALLVKVDRAAMATSLETRAPLLDHRVLEFSLGLPHERVRGKSLLRELLYRRVPRELIDRPKKGFGVPLNRWFREDLRELLRDTVTPQRLADLGLHQPDMVTRLIREHEGGRIDHSARLWALLVLCLWLQERQ